MALKTEELDVHDRVNGKVQHTRAGAFVVHDCYCDKCPLCVETVKAEVAALAAARLALQQENETFRLALESLTPGGSEYVADADACVAYVRQVQQSQHRVIVKLKERADAAEAVVTALRQECRFVQEQLASGAEKLRLNREGMTSTSVTHWAIWLHSVARDLADRLAREET